MTEKVVFPGSFDPVTIGHVSVVMKILPLFEKVYIAIGENTAKKSMFSIEKRVEWLKKAFEKENKVEIITYSSLTTDLCRKLGAKYMIRGIRNPQDYAYESNIEKINKILSPEVHTLYVPSDRNEDAVSSTFIREILSFGGDVKPFLPEGVNITKEDIL